MQPDLDQFHTQIEPDSEATEEESRSGVAQFLFDLLETLVLSALLFIGINAISARIRVDGSSMEPTLHSGEFVIVNKLAYQFGTPDYGDVVVFHFPRDPDQEYIKRVVGLPGDQLRIEEGTLHVNEHPLEESYIAASPAYQGTWSVPEGNLFVLGDNRNNSSDSHNWGPVPLDNVIGKAFFVYWPPPDWGIIVTPEVAIAAP